jgi:hypothetical protein
MVAFVRKVFIRPLVLALVSLLGLVDAFDLVFLLNLPCNTLFFFVDLEADFCLPIQSINC